MNRREALRILGLGEDATAADIKTAYKETAQILHPDRFEGNKKLQERATEQFKNLQEAYQILTEEGRRTHSRSTVGADGKPRRTVRSKSADAAARLAGIAAARVQLVAQRDLALDERRNGAIMTVAGAIVAFVCGRRAFGLLGIVAAIAVTFAVWGIAQVVSAQRTISTIDDHLAELASERERLEKIVDGES